MQNFNEYLFLGYFLLGIAFYLYFYKLGSTKLDVPLYQCPFNIKLFFLLIIITIWPIILYRVISYKKDI